MAHKISRFGWQPDLPDYRDLTFAAERATLRKLPTKVDLSKQCPPVYHQGILGSCTANAVGAAFQFGLLKQDAARAFTPSRLFIYYNERVIEKTVSTDHGAQLRTGIKTVHKQGVCPENMWPYQEDKFAHKPHPNCYAEALKNQAISYHRVSRNLNQMKSCLAEGYPFVFGFTVYDYFEGDDIKKTGKLNMPKKGEAEAGGHAALVVGYVESSKRFIVRNSWGPEWGNKGYFTIPYDYVLNENLSDDFWTIRLVELTAVEKAKSNKDQKARDIAKKK